MPLIRMDELLKKAKREKYAIGAFECWDSAIIRGIAESAAKCRMPVIFQASPAEYNIMGGADKLRKIVEIYVEDTGIEAALHLDHGSRFEHVMECIDAGFTSVMLDASMLPYEENIAISKQAAEMAHKAGICIETELGHVGGAVEGEIRGDNDFLTDPDQAKKYVNDTAIDCLAVAIGTVHGEYKGIPCLRFDCLEKISKCISIPLVLHGGSGTPPKLLLRAIEMGVAKINICTDIHKAWLEGVGIAKESRSISVPGNFYIPAHEAIVAKAMEIIELFKNRK